MKKKKESKCKTFVLKYHIINNLIVSNYELTIRIYIMEKKSLQTHPLIMETRARQTDKKNHDLFETTFRGDGCWDTFINHLFSISFHFLSVINC